MSPKSSRGPKKALRLTDREREYLETGETGSYRESQLEERIQKKVDHLPQRFETLFSDVELLHENGKLDVDSWSRGWSRLLSHSDELAPKEMAEAIVSSRSEVHNSRSSYPAKFARRLGRTLDRLLLKPKHVDSDEIRHDIIWGFALGIYLNRRSLGETTTDEGRHRMREVAEMMAERTEEALKTDESALESIAETMSRRKRWEGKREEMIEYIAELLESEEIISSRETRLKKHLPDDSEVDLTSLATKVVDYWIDSQVDDGLPGTYDQWSTFIDEHDRNVFDAKGVLTVEKVQQLIDDNRLVERVQFTELLRRDATRVRAGEYKRVPKEPVLMTVFQTSGVSSPDIHKAMEGEGHLSGVTRIARDFAGDRRQRQTDTGDIWAERPLLDGDKDGWSTTAYGNALGHYLSNTPQEPTHETPDDVDAIEMKQLWAMSVTVPEDALIAALEEIRD